MTNRDDQLLSICIPVFNQAAELGITLKSIESCEELLAGVLDGKVQVIISNNASTDIPPSMKARASNFGIEWLDQTVNLGFAGNLNALGKASTAKYIWYLGAGETIDPSKWTPFFESLTKTDFVCGTIAANLYDANSGVTIPATKKWDGLKKIFPLLRSPYTESISSNIYSRAFLLNGFGHGISGNLWPHVELVLQNLRLRHYNRVAFFPGGIVTVYQSKDGWWTKSGSDAAFYWHLACLLSNTQTFVWPAVLLKLWFMLTVGNFRVLSVEAKAGLPFGQTNAYKILSEHSAAQSYCRAIYNLAGRFGA